MSSAAVPGRFLVPAANASARTGALVGSVAIPGRSSLNRARGVGQERPDRRALRDHRVERRWRGADRVLEVRRRHARERPERAVEVDEQRGLGVRDRRQRPGERLESVQEPGQVRVRRGEVARHRLQVPEQRDERDDRVVEADASTGEPVAVADGRGDDPLARRRAEHRQHLVEVDGGAGLTDRHGGAARERPPRRPQVDREVLLADRALQPDRERRVDRQRPDALVELQSEYRDRLALGGALRLHAVDEPDERAAQVDLGAMGQLARVGDLDVERVARDEREAVARVVGEEHGDDHGEHGDRADQDRIGEPAAVRTVVHPPGPIR